VRHPRTRCTGDSTIGAVGRLVGVPSEWTPREPPTVSVDATFVLDRWRREDAAALRQFDLDPRTARFFGWTVKQARALPDEHYDGEQRAQGNLAAWRLGEQLSLAIRRRADGEAVGWVELRPDGNEAAVSYMVTPDLRGQGIVPRALDALLGWAAAEVGIRRARLHCHVQNVASRRVAEKCGFMFLGRHGDEFRFRRDLRA
jgi:[ribosomal protein S5]-alanine N-acetyltransferase